MRTLPLNKGLLLAGVVWLILSQATPQPIQAQSPDGKGPGQAGLLIISEAGEQQVCVDLPSTESTGLDLLRVAGVDFMADYGNALGASICKIDDTGCDFPGQDCFCQCQGADCVYWSYYKRLPGTDEWLYSQSGAAISPVLPGTVDAWIWTTGESGSTERRPPDRSFAELCAAGAAAVSLSPSKGLENWSSYGGFLGLIVLLLSFGIYQRYRKNRVNRISGG